MLDGTHWFECTCGADEHTIRFTLYMPKDDPEDKELYTCVFLDPHNRWWKRIWLAIKYIFSYKSRFGHFGNWTMHENDAERLRDMCIKFIEGKAA